MSKEQMNNDAIKEQLISQHQKTQTNTEYPTEVVELPSKGLAYSLDNPLSSGKVEMKYMTAKEEDILTSDNLLKKGIAIDRLLQSLIVGNGDGKKINYNDLLVGDKNAVMMAARVLGYGGKYETKVNCPKCGEENIIEVDITSFRDREIDFSKFNNENRFDFSLPISKKVITFRLTTHGDEMQAASAAKARKGKNRYGERTQSQVTARLKQQIISVDNDDSSDLINATVDTMLSRDSLALRNYIREITPDLETDVYFECEHCGYAEDIPFPITQDFFWPRV